MNGTSPNLFGAEQTDGEAQPTGGHALGTELLLADGSARAVETIRLGEALMGPNGYPRRVLAAHRGHGVLTRIFPRKGGPFTVSFAHRLALQLTGGGERRIVTVGEWFGWPRWRRHIFKLERTGIASFGTHAELPSEPYFLGVLLGDGCLLRAVMVSSPELEIAVELGRQAERWGLRVRVQHKAPSLAREFFLAGSVGGSGNPLVGALRELGVWGCMAREKHVPRSYLLAPARERAALLSGLLDTDGHYSGGGFDFVSASSRLAHDVVFLARSLGLAAYVRRKTCRAYLGNVYYRISISGHVDHLPLRVERKRPAPRRQRKDVLRTGFSVEPAGKGDFVGFEVDGDGLYLAGDFTVHGGVEVRALDKAA